MATTRTSYQLIIRSVDARRVLLVESQRGWDLPGFGETGPWRPWHEQGHLIAWAARAGLGELVILRVWRGNNPYHDNLVIRLYEACLRFEDDVPVGAEWFARHEIQKAASDARRMLEEWFATANSGVTSTPWSEPGWLEGAEEWIREQVSRLDPAAIVTIKQHRVWHKSCLLRVSAEQRHFHFKACHPAYPDETALAVCLARWHPDQFAEIVVHHPNRRWLLMAAAEGPVLESSDEISDWLEALEAYTAVQKHLADRTADLLDVGCTKLDGSLALRAFDALNDSETLRTADPHGLTRQEADRFASLRPLVERTAADLDASTLPVTWVRGDAFAEHAVKTGSHWRFLDVEDSLITIPLVGLADWLPRREGAGRLWDAVLGWWSIEYGEPAIDLAERLRLVRSIYGLYRLKTLVLPQMDDGDRHAPVIADRLRRVLESEWLANLASSDV